VARRVTSPGSAGRDVTVAVIEAAAVIAGGTEAVAVIVQGRVQGGEDHRHVPDPDRGPDLGLQDQDHALKL